VQAAWLKLSRTDAGDIENIGGWLTTVVARVSIDMLRKRRSRREEPAIELLPLAASADPEGEAVLADSVGEALLLLLETLTPQERLAFVLHEMFDMPFAGRCAGQPRRSGWSVASRSAVLIERITFQRA
jgi:RNA polymerase sigma-70 factor (ECF subfamily)